MAWLTSAREAGETTIETAIFRIVTTAREAGETTIENRTIWGKVTTAREAGETEIETIPLRTLTEAREAGETTTGECNSPLRAPIGHIVFHHTAEHAPTQMFGFLMLPQK